MEEDKAGTNKRSRNEEEIEQLVVSPDVKRIRAEFLLDILEDESKPDRDDSDAATDDLYSVMRSLEEEIASLPPDPVETQEPGPNPQLPDLGFLLEASDDELGLPPAGVAGGEVDVAGGVADVNEAVGFGKIWDLDDEFRLDFGFEFGSGERDNGLDDGGVMFDGGLFEFDDGMRSASDFSDLTWQPEFLPAV